MANSSGLGWTIGPPMAEGWNWVLQVVFNLAHTHKCAHTHIHLSKMFSKERKKGREDKEIF